MVVAWLIYYQDAAIYNQKYIQWYFEEGKKLGIDVKLILVEELEFGVEQNHRYLRYQNKNIQMPDFAICRAIYPMLSKQLELLGIAVFNNSFVSDICNNKAKTYQYLADLDILMVDSTFYRNQDIEEVINQIHLPTIIKAVDGHGGTQVFLLDDPVMVKSKNEMIQGIGTSDFVVQPLVGNQMQDVRVYVIGTRIVASVIRTATKGFRANYSLGGAVSLYQLSQKEREVVERIIDRFEFGLVGIDFIRGEHGELIFNEIEDVVGSRMLYQCSKINIVEQYLTYVLHRLKYS